MGGSSDPPLLTRTGSSEAEVKVGAAKVTKVKDGAAVEQITVASEVDLVGDASACAVEVVEAVDDVT